MCWRGCGRSFSDVPYAKPMSELAKALAAKAAAEGDNNDDDPDAVMDATTTL